MKPVVQICVDNILDVPTQKIRLIEMLQKRRLSDPPWSVRGQMDVGKTTQAIGPLSERHYGRNVDGDTIASRHAFTVCVLTIVRMTPDSG
jgi:hypothetical protein